MEKEKIAGRECFFGGPECKPVVRVGLVRVVVLPFSDPHRARHPGLEN